MTAMAMEMSLKKNFNEQSNGAYVQYNSREISLPSSAKQQGEMTKFWVVWRM